MRIIRKKLYNCKKDFTAFMDKMDIMDTMDLKAIIDRNALLRYYYKTNS